MGEDNTETGENRSPILRNLLYGLLFRPLPGPSLDVPVVSTPLPQRLTSATPTLPLACMFEKTHNPTRTGPWIKGGWYLARYVNIDGVREMYAFYDT